MDEQNVWVDVRSVAYDPISDILLAAAAALAGRKKADEF